LALRQTAETGTEKEKRKKVKESETGGNISWNLLMGGSGPGVWVHEADQMLVFADTRRHAGRHFDRILSLSGESDGFRCD